VKVRDEGMVRNKAVYVALALDTAGQKHVLGLWIEQTEGAKCWLRVYPGRRFGDQPPPMTGGSEEDENEAAGPRRWMAAAG